MFNIANCNLSDYRLEDHVGVLARRLIESYNDELEETLLACLAAGVPVDCIEVLDKEPVYDSSNYTLTKKSYIKFKYQL